MKGKPFKETKVGGWLSKNAPKALDIIGEIYPPVGKIRDLVRGHDQVTAEQEAELNELLMEYDKELLHAEVADLASARSMQVAALQQEDPVAKRFVYVLAAFIVVGTFVYGFALFFIDIPEGNQRLVDMFADVSVFAGFSQVLNFFFGNAFTKMTRKKMEGR